MGCFRSEGHNFSNAGGYCFLKWIRIEKDVLDLIHFPDRAGALAARLNPESLRLGERNLDVDVLVVDFQTCLFRCLHI